MTAKPRKPLLVNLTWAGVLIVLLPVMYVLSYAPAYRLKFGKPVPVVVSPQLHLWGSYEPPFPTIRLQERRWWVPISCYYPVEWMIEHTPLREPLFWWAGRFGVEDDFRYAADHDWPR
jgi:hypothetical protein